VEKEIKRGAQREPAVSALECLELVSGNITFEVGVIGEGW
jgi:hypothetical protein